jgi:hypothetical protein
MTTLNAILGSGLLFFAVGYFIARCRYKQAERLNDRYHLRWYEIDKAVNDYRWHWDATSTLLDKITFLLTEKGNQAAELKSIDTLLNVPALDKQKTRYNKIAFAIDLLKGAAIGQKVSNRDEDYR